MFPDDSINEYPKFNNIQTSRKKPNVKIFGEPISSQKIE